MKFVNTGITRYVFLVGDLAIKIPRVIGPWNHFLTGLLSNLREKDTWNYNQYDPHRKKLAHWLLCPVVWGSWGGWVLVMKRATTCQDLDITHYKAWKRAGFGGDDKRDNYGWLEGRIVKLDYGSY